MCLFHIFLFLPNIDLIPSQKIDILTDYKMYIYVVSQKESQKEYKQERVITVGWAAAVLR